MDLGNTAEFVSDSSMRPRNLFRRYDSISGSSESTNSSFSSSSLGSSQQIRSGQCDRTRRRRTVSSNLHSSRFDEESNSVLTKGNDKYPSTGTGSTSDDPTGFEEACIFCSSLVHERQYYLWHSQYTKSSLCSRCNNDNEGMRYISYWGTPSYEGGSWKKRFRDGRSFDIDLSPLFEVLDKIDQMDTSMYGRKNRKNEQRVGNQFLNDERNKTDFTVLKETHETMESAEMSARRRRRLENRKKFTLSSEDVSVKETFTENKHDSNNTKEGFENSHNANKRTIANDHVIKSDENNNNNSKEFVVFETCSQSEQVEIIQPINVVRVEQHTLHDVQNGTMCDNDNTLPIQRPNQFSSADRISEYLQTRRKSNYEDFIAGLEIATPLQRRSTAENDLGVKIKKVRDNKKREKRYYCPKSRRVRRNTPYIADMNDSEGNITSNRDENENTSVHNLNKVGKDADANVSDESKEIVDKSNLESRDKTKQNCDNETDENNDEARNNSTNTKSNIQPVKAHSPSGITSRKYKPRKPIRIPSPVVTSQSSEENETENVTFTNIKNKFENLCRGKSDKNKQSLRKKPSISKERFRSQYLKTSDPGHFSDSSAISDEDIGRSYKPATKNHSVDKTNISTLNSIKHNQTNITNNKQYRLASDNSIEEQHLNEGYNGDISQYDGHKHVLTPDTSLINNSQQSTIGEVTNELISNSTDNSSSYSESAIDKTTNIEDSEASAEILSNSDEDEGTQMKHSPFHTEFNDNQNAFSCGNETSPITKLSNISSGSNDICETVENSRHNSEESQRSYDTESRETDTFESNHVNTEIPKAFSKRRNRYNKNRYVGSVDETEHENPDIERIKKKLRRKPKYEGGQSDDSDKDEAPVELNGSNDEEVELCWRTRGYTKDFYMSRSSVTGSEIIARYNRAVSNRRSRRPDKIKGTNTEFSNMGNIMTQSEPSSRYHSKLSSKTNSAPLTRACTSSNLEKENSNTDSKTNCNDISAGVSATALKDALNRAAKCSKRMSKRLKSQLEEQSESDASCS